MADEANVLGDLHEFDTMHMTWTKLSDMANANQMPPDRSVGFGFSARYDHGFAAMEGKLFVHGGNTYGT